MSAMKIISKLFPVLLLLGASILPFGKALASDEAPDALVKRVTAEVLTIIKNDKDLQSGNMKKVNELVDQKILPHFNFNRMTALAVGQDWRSASAEQKTKLSAEFKTLLVRTYANALVSYKNQSIDVKPLKLDPKETDVTVRTEVRQTSGQPIPLDYSLQKKDDGWKVYDVIVGGVSLVTNYRDEFKQTVRQGGIDGLLASLTTKNAQPVQTPGAKK
jgi:phospholipid transport system substrate-binding protein